MIPELLSRFVLGGAVVASFAAIGELFKPKRFSGMFGSAPSVALATLAVTFAKAGPSYVSFQGRSMLAGAVAMLVYCAVAVAVMKVRRIPVWMSALAGWVVWVAVASGLWALGRAVGALP